MGYILWTPPAIPTPNLKAIRGIQAPGLCMNIVVLYIDYNRTGNVQVNKL